MQFVFWSGDKRLDATRDDLRTMRRIVAASAYPKAEIHLPVGASFEVGVLDRQHGDAVTEWEAMGQPEPPTREQTAELRRLVWDTKKEVLQADKDGRLHFRMSMPAWSLVLVKQM